MFELLAPAISVAANGQLIWSGFRAWRIKNRILKWSGAGLTDLLSAIATTIGVLLIVGALKLHARNAPAVALKISDTPELIRCGEEIFNGVDCDIRLASSVRPLSIAFGLPDDAAIVTRPPCC
jgi:hypothetical protein